MACVDQDKFNLVDHGHSVRVALEQLMHVPAIRNGALGTIIVDLQQKVLPLIGDVKWIPDNGNNAGNAAGFFERDDTAPNKIKIKKVNLSVMENKRSQIVHEMIHGLDMYYYYFNLSHAPLEARLKLRVPVLYLFPVGDIWKYNLMDIPLADPVILDRHTNLLTQFLGLASSNSLLKSWQRQMLVRQLDYAKRADKVHVEFTANVAQCLALIYQWGFTGAEKGLLGNPRSISLLIRGMEMALQEAIQGWRSYVPPARKQWSVVQFQPGDRRMPSLEGVHFSKDNWWKELGKAEAELVMKPDLPPKPGNLRAV
jgi:hypothetical protein